MHVRLFLVAVGVVAFLFLPASIEASDAPVLQQANTYSGNEEITGWLMSEKLDGIRGYWTGKELVTRKGRTIHAPEKFTNSMPPFALDGELWRKRDDFNFVQNTVLDGMPSEGWEEITYNIFEVPDMAGDFRARLDKARQWFDTHPAPHIRIIEQIECKGPDHLDAFLAEIESSGGEGIIIKNPNLPYHSGRSPHILKVKNFSDMEGIVIAHHPGKGQFTGMLGSLTLRLENNVEFKLGTGFTIADRKQPPPIGTVVTFKYQGFTKNGIPRFASFLHVRKD